MRHLFAVLTLLLFALQTVTHAADVLIVSPPVPGLAASEHSQVRVRSACDGGEWQSVFAWKTVCKAFQKDIDRYFDTLAGWTHTYVNFETIGAVEVKNTRVNDQPIRSAAVHPQRKASACSIKDGRAYVMIDEPCLVAVDIDGQMDSQDTGKGCNGSPIHTISLFANPLLEGKPKLDASGVLTVKPGEVPPSELEQIVKYVDSGKPIIVLRTANHGFRAPLPYKIDGRQVRWGEDILGGTFLNHHGRWHADSTRGTFDKDQLQHPILTGVTDIWGDSDVYRTFKEGTSLPAGCTALVWGQPLMGRMPDDPPNEKLEPLPVAWTKLWQTSRGMTARVFHSTMGSGTDLKRAGLRRLIINAACWGIGMEPSISATRSVAIVGDYRPLESGFNYDTLGVKPRPVTYYR